MTCSPRPLLRARSRSPCRRAGQLLALLAVSLAASIPGALAAPADGRMETVVRAYLQDQTRGLPGEVVITVDPVDPRSRLGQCDAFAPAVPNGARLWGRTAIAVRCLGPANWEIYVPVRIQVFGDHLRSARRLAAGQQLAAGDLAVVRGDLTALPDGVLTEPTQAVGLRLRLGLAQGLPLLKDHLVIPPAIRQGQVVRLVARGQGFAVSSEGTAMTNAAEGAQVVVRTASGQTVRGIARAEGVVEVDF